MPWYAVAMIILIAISSAVVVLKVNKPQTPNRPVDVLAILAINALYIWGIVELAVR